MANRLANAASPYLLQHAENPVDWYQWGDEAFAAAAERDVPILLSVGYAACHWCHVMAHESFEDEATAAVMNDGFVNVKVDREERPDIDRIYMEATQAMTGSGGWPMTVFLTPQAAPFFAGTYFPKDSRHGMPSFTTILNAISDAWSTRRDDVEAQAKRLIAAVAHEVPKSDTTIDNRVLEAAYHAVIEQHDEELGGFGGAPKFPQAPVLEFLLRVADEPWAPQAKHVLGSTLRAMAAGGIYDQLGGGFARYSVDRRWLVPHFEKMLYDNALLARIYLRAWQVIGDDDLLRVARETLDYLLRDLALPGGGLASSEDADSEGAEGTFYVWHRKEFLAIAGGDGPIVADRYGVTDDGNFEGSNILSLAAPAVEVAARHGVDVASVDAAVARARSALFAHRSRRVRPARDDKAVAAWNGLGLRAIAEAALVLGDAAYLAAAQGLAEFLGTEMRRHDGRLLRARREGMGEVPAFCDDYAATILGMLAVHQADGSERWLTAAVGLTEQLVELFSAPNGGFYGVGEDANELITRPLDVMDNPVPSGNSLAAEALLAIGHLSGRADLLELVGSAVEAGGGLIERHPSAVGHLLAVAHSRGVEPRELAIVGDADDDRTQALVTATGSAFRPAVFMARASGDTAPISLFEGRVPSPRPVAYLCRRFACDAPTSDPDHLIAQLGRTMPHS